MADQNPPASQKNKQIVRTTIVHTSGTFLENVENYLQNIFIYTEKDTGSDKRIQKNSLYNKNTPKYNNALQQIRIFRKQKTTNYKRFLKNIFYDSYCACFVYFASHDHLPKVLWCF